MSDEKTAEQLQKQLEGLRTEVAELEADLPTIKRKRDQAAESVRKARGRGQTEKRMELVQRRAGYEAVYAAQQQDIEELRGEIRDLEQQLRERQERERVDRLVEWAERRNQEGAETFAKALAQLEAAQEVFNEVHRAVAPDVRSASRSSGARTPSEQRLRELPSFGFKGAYLQNLPDFLMGNSGRVPLERYVERLKEQYPRAFKG